jgi:hypothetical protein
MHLKFSQDIEALLHRLHGHPLTLGEILTETSERGFSLMIGLLTLPFLSPIPLLGLNGVLGSGSVLLGLQMAFGLRSPWLPKRMASITFPSNLAKPLLTVVRQFSRLLEKMSRRRLLKLAENPYVWRFNGFCMAWLTFLLILPIPLPLANSVPAASILVLVAATLESDGFLMCVGYGLAIVNTIAFGTLGYLLLNTPTLIQDFWNSVFR